MNRFRALLVGTLSLLLFASGARARDVSGGLEASVGQILAGGPVDAAVARIQYLGQQREATLALAQKLEAADPRVRQSIVLAISLLRAPEGGPALEHLLADRDPAIRLSAAQGCARLGVRNSGALLPLLQDLSSAVRQAGAAALAETGDRSIVGRVMQALKKEDEPEARAALLVALGKLGSPKLSPQLRGYLRSPSEATRLAAAQALTRLGDPRGQAFVKGLLTSKDCQSRRQGERLVEGFPLPLSRRYLKPLLTDPDAAVAGCAARILYQAGDKKMLSWLVLASHQAFGDDKLAYENELERLTITEAQRNEILAAARIIQ